MQTHSDIQDVVAMRDQLWAVIRGSTLTPLDALAALVGTVALVADESHAPYEALKVAHDGIVDLYPDDEDTEEDADLEKAALIREGEEILAEAEAQGNTLVAEIVKQGLAVLRA